MQLIDIARVIWRNTYRHDTLLEWWEIQVGTLHYKRTMDAAVAVRDLFFDDKREEQ